ncbi:MAG: glycosyltransferase, partial [Actinomycetota bacterium]|nr:glycosyltransferase [Actinomycetota bacterium]
MLASTALIRGGVWRHIEDLGLGLERAGVEVTVGLLPGASDLHDAARRAGLRSQSLYRTLGRSTGLWHVHLHDSFDRRAFLALVARRAAGPSVITEHLPRSHASDDRLEPQYPRTRYAAEVKTAFKRLEFRLGGAVIAVGASSARFLEERYSLAPGAVRTVHNGVTVPAPVAGPRPHLGPLRVVTVGSLDRQKGHDVLLEAARRSARDWEVTVIGSGPQLEPLRSIAAGLPPGRVRFTGWVDDPRALLEAADVVCIPSRWESFPYAALEACSLARAVVASRVDGLDEIIVDGESGILVAPDDPGALAAA